MSHSVQINYNKLKQLREEQVLSQEGLEHACRQVNGCSVSIASIKRAESGKRISRSTAARLARFFAIPIEELIISDPMPPEKTSNRNRSTSIVLWLHSPIKQLLNKAAEKASAFSPYMLQRVGDTLIVAIPFSYLESGALLSPYTLLKTCYQFSHYKVLLSIETLEQQSPFQWSLEPNNMTELSSTANTLPDKSIAVANALYNRDSMGLHHHTSPSNGYHILYLPS